jgi:hypothetical protein
MSKGMREEVIIAKENKYFKGGYKNNFNLNERRLLWKVKNY